MPEKNSEQTRDTQTDGAWSWNAERIQAVLDGTDPFLLLDERGMICHVNAEFLRVFDYARDAVLAQAFTDFLPQADKARVMEAARSDSPSQHITHRVLRRDGASVPVDTTVRVLREPRAKFAALYLRPRIETADADAARLKQSEADYRYLFENNPHPMWAYDAQTLKFLAVNDAAVFKYGYSRQEFLNMTIADIRPAQDVERLEQNLARARDVIEHSGEWRHKLKDGTIIDVEISSHALTLQERAAVLVVAQDITARKEAERSLLSSNERFLQMANNIHEVFWMFDNQLQKLVYLNPAYQEIWGCSIQDTYRDAQVYIQAIHPQDRGIMFNALETQSRGQGTDMEYRILRPDGSIRWIHDRSFPVQDAQGNTMRTTGIATDITREKLALEKLRESERDLRALVTSLDDIVFEVDETGTYVNVWVADEALLFQPRAQIIGKRFDEIFGAQASRPFFEVLHRVLASGNSETLDYSVELAGTTRWFAARYNPIRSQGSARKTVSVLVRDITERKHLEHEAQYRQTLLEKVIRLGKNVTAITDPDACLREIYHSIRDELNFDRVGVFLYDRASRTVQGVYGTSRTGEIQDKRWYSEKLDDLWFWQDILIPAMGMHVIDDYQAMFHPSPDNEMYGVKQNVTVVAWAGAEPVAIISADNLISQRVMRPADLEALNLFAGYAGLAIANAQLNASLEQRVQARTKELGQSEATYRALFENSNDAILLLRTDGTILSVNSRCVDILQYSVQEMLDRNSQDFIAPAELQDADERWERVLAGEAIPIYERKLLRKDGTLVDCDINLSLVRDEAGQPKLVQSLFRDITARKQAENVLRESEAKLRQSEAELRQANMVLEKAARLKDEFLATMSHELRTPLNSILGLSEVLAEQITGPLNERQLRSVRTIESSGRHLLTLINDILDLSKIEAGALVLNHAPIMVRDFCDNCLVFIKETAHKKKIKLSSTIDFHVMWIDGDERRLKQVFVNLLSNAVKFTAEGGRVDFQVQGDPEGGIVRFSVRDTGIGISAQDMPRLFRPFVQLDSGLTRRFEGTGLGLALVARMVELHGGSVSVESEPGQGSCFTITLPWTQEMQHLDFNTLSAAGAPAKQKAGDIATDANAPLIMIVEDNDANRDTLAVYLRAKGYNVTTAKNGAQAIDAANRDLPALVLMDVQMPIMDGLEAIRRLRASTQTQIANVPIIALTAFAMPGDRERALQAGANAYMSKPVNLKELVQAVQALLEYKDAAAANTAD